MKRISTHPPIVANPTIHTSALDEQALSPLGEEGAKFFVNNEQRKAEFLAAASAEGIRLDEPQRIRTCFRQFRRSIIPKGDRPSKEQDGVTKLMQAVIDGDAKRTEQLLNGKANIAVGMGRKTGNRALAYQARNLLRAYLPPGPLVGPDIGSKFAESLIAVCDAPHQARNALTCAVATGNVKILQLLCSFAVSQEQTNLLDLPDGNGSTPLTLAVEDGLIDCCRTIVTHGADVNKANARQKTPLEIAFFHRRDEIVDYLLQRGAALSLSKFSAIVKNSDSRQCKLLDQVFLACINYELSDFVGRDYPSCRAVFGKLEQLIAPTSIPNAQLRNALRDIYIAKKIATQTTFIEAAKDLESICHHLEIGCHPPELRSTLFKKLSEMLCANAQRVDPQTIERTIYFLTRLDPDWADTLEERKARQAVDTERLASLKACYDAACSNLTPEDVSKLFSLSDTGVKSVLNWAVSQLASLSLSVDDSAVEFIDVYGKVRALTQNLSPTSEAHALARKSIGTAYETASADLKRAIESKFGADEATKFQPFING